YTWTVTDNLDVTGETDSDATGQIIGTSIQQTLNNNTDVAQRVTYTITPWPVNEHNTNNCPGTPVSVEVWIEPTVTVDGTPDSDTLCSGELVSIDLNSISSPTRPVLFRYQTVKPYGVNVLPGSGNAIINGANLADVLTNSTDTAKLVLFVITPYTRHADSELEKCPGMADTVRIWVEPVPKVSLTPLRDTICTSLRPSIETSSVTRSLQPVKLAYETIYNLADVEVFHEQDTFDLNPGYVLIDSIVNHSTIPQQVTFITYPYLTGIFGERKCAGIPDTSWVWVAPKLRIVADTVSTWVGGRNIRCNGQNNGFIQLNPEGGLTAFAGYNDNNLNYSWNSGWKVTKDINNLYAGNYTITVSDKLQCMDDSLFILTQPLKLLSQIDVIDTLSCHGNDGTIAPIISGGTAPYMINWNTVPNDYYLDAPVYQDTLINVMDGQYEVTILDTNGCIVNASILLQQPQAFTIYVAPYNVSGQYEIRCNGENSGAILSQNTKGTMLTYHWTSTNGMDTTFTNSDGINLLQNLPAGRYTLNYTDVEECSGLFIQDMTQPEPLSIEQVTLSSYSGIYNVSCFNSEDGRIELNDIQGGHAYGPYSYNWDVVSGPGTVNSSARNQVNLAPGLYTVTVSDSFNCAVADTFELTAPGEIVISADLSSSVAGGYNLNCFGESTAYIKLQASGGGTSEFHYAWDHTTNTSNELYDLSSGEYRVTVTDGLGCQERDTIVLIQPSKLEIDSVGLSDYKGYGIRCRGGSDGSIFIGISGGTPGYLFGWSANGTLLLQDTAYIENLTGGNYGLTLTDANNCQTSWSGSLTEPPAMDLIIDAKNVNCTGTVLGSAQAEISGGIAPYNYSWDNGAVTPNLSGLAMGIYVLTVLDDNLCEIIDTAVIEQNTDVLIDIQVTDPISCHQSSDGELRAVPSGGVGPYTYAWLDGPFSQSYAGLGEGTYTVTVNDDEGCTGTQSIFLDDPDPLSIVFTVTDALCFGSSDGMAGLGALGGTGTYTYLWNNIPVNGDEVDGLRAGNYALRVVDTENCEADTLVMIQQPDKLHIAIDTFNTVYPFCPDWQNGAMAVTVTGGHPAYQFDWGDLFPDDTDSILNDIKEGSYTVSVLDNNHCQADTTFRLTAQNSSCLGIPTAFTPNYDNANDTWDISYITEEGVEASFHEVYPNGVIQVYDQLGNLVYRCTGGCPEAWNGEDLKGRALPVDSYYFIIELNTGDDKAPLKGIVTIIR
ncbi:MAG: gliding motility-associated C-terminal domain-containing protein, partial [Bacteroidales bacterium]|nr:gliding motility-associated C-terminal domain-containing protein [Bacteroidales bacterium]